MVLQGFTTKWAFKASTGDPSTSSFAAGATRFDLVSDSVKRNAPIVDSKGIAGTRGKFKGRARIPQATYEGTLVFEVSPAILAWFIVYMMHDTSGTTPYELSETVAEEFDFMRDDGATVYLYKNCIVTGFTIRGTSGGLVELSMNVSAKAEAVTGSADAQAMPSLTLGTTTAYEPIIAGESSISLAGSVRECDDFTITVDHGVNTKHRMSVGPTSYLPGMRTVSFATNTVWGATEENTFYGAGEAGFAAVATIGRAAMNSVFTFTNLVVSDNAPAVTGPDELLYGIEGVAKGDLPISTSKEISITVDSTP